MTIIIPKQEKEENKKSGVDNVFIEFITLEEAKETRRVIIF